MLDRLAYADRLNMLWKLDSATVLSTIRVRHTLAGLSSGVTARRAGVLLDVQRAAT